MQIHRIPQNPTARRGSRGSAAANGRLAAPSSSGGGLHQKLLSTSTLTPTAAWTVPRTLIPWPAHVGAPVFLLFFNPLEARLPPRHRVWRWRVVGTGTLCWIDSTLALVLAEILKSDF